MSRSRKDRPKSLMITRDFLERNSDQDPRLGIILRIANHLSTPLTLDQLLTLIMGGLSELLEADRSTLFLLSNDGTYLWSKVAEGDRVEEIRVDVGEGIAGWVAQTGRQLIIKDAYKDPRFDSDWDRRNNYHTSSLLCLPVLNREGELMGVAQVLNKREGYFTVDDAMMLRTIMAMTAISIVNARLYNTLLDNNLELLEAQRDLNNRIHEIDLLYGIERDVSVAANLSATIETLLLRIRETMPCAAIEVALLGDDGTINIHRLGIEGGGVEVQHFERPVGFVGRCLLQGMTLELSTLSDREQETLTQEEALPETPHNGVCVPMLKEEQALGVLALFGRPTPTRRFDANDTKLITLIAAHTTRLVSMRQEQEQAERKDRLNAIGQAIAGVLHDFKTPMTIASGYVQMMVGKDDREERRSMATSVLRQLERVSQMSRDVLSFARGDSDVFVQRVLLNDFTEEASELIGQILKKTDIAWEVQTSYRGVGYFDRLKLLRVVQNMTRNARDAMRTQQVTERKKRFSFSIADDDEQLVFTFSDTGAGVPLNFQHRLFEAFATRGKKDGTGLGLAMVKQFAEVHGGGVSYRDTPGGGATFVLRIDKETRGTQAQRPETGIAPIPAPQKPD